MPDEPIEGGLRRTIIDAKKAWKEQNKVLREQMMECLSLILRNEVAYLRQDLKRRKGQLREWISAKEQLPDEGIDVLVTVNGQFDSIFFHNALQIGTYYGADIWVIAEFPGWEDPDVLAWMPLPKPYKESE